MQAGKKYTKDSLQIAMSPFTRISISQYDGEYYGQKSYSHNGTHAFDITNGNYDKAPYYAPCDVICKAINKTYCFTCWQSEKEVYAYYKGSWIKTFMTFLFGHDESINCYVGQKITQGTQIGNMGKGGNATGVHCHFECAPTKFSEIWIKNSYGVYMLRGNVRPNEILLLDDADVIVKSALSWNRLSAIKNTPQAVERDLSKWQCEVIVDNLRMRSEPSTDSSNLGYIAKGIYDVSDQKKDSYNWYNLGNVWIADDGGQWVKNYPINTEEKEDEELIKVIDVSYYQQNIDYAKVKAAGIKGVILRCGRTGYGASKSKQEDSMFKKHYEGFKAVGMPVGAYYYSCAVTEAEAKKEAELVKTILKDKKLDYPVYFDTEDNHDINATGNSKTSQYSIGKTKLTKVAQAFLQTLEDAGYFVGIYASKSWLENQLDMSQLSEYAVWLAQYASQPTYKGEYGMWQYSSTGRVDGISGNVDMNYCYEDYPTIIKNKGLNGYSKPQTDEKDKQIAELQKQVTELETELQTANNEVTRLKKKVNEARAILNAN